jgi:hypothetical protein
MTSIAEAPSCPRCGETMVLRTAGRGAYAGQQFWACPRFPQCWGKRGIAGQAPAEAEAVRETPVSNEAGASAQATFERRLAARKKRVRALWPVMVGITLVLMVLAYLVGLSLGLPWLGASAAAVVALVMLWVVVDRPQFVDAWRIGAEGERKTSSKLRDLEAQGFIVLDDRRAPGYGGNIDHLVIGPTGVWAVETKSLKGSVEVASGRLVVNGGNQDKIVDQVYRQATAIQIALREVLAPAAIGVIPVLCVHRARLPLIDRDIQGVQLTTIKTLTKTVSAGPTRLSAAQIADIAEAANRIMPKARG